jgi:HSP20 family protein
MSSRNPFQEIEEFFDRMSREFESESDVLGGDESRFRWSSDESMPIDLIEYDDELVATVELPGFEQDDVDIQVTDHTLRISADHEEAADEERESETGHMLRHERRHETATRSIQLPEEVDKEAVNATMQHGILTVTLPKTESKRARTIEIE